MVLALQDTSVFPFFLGGIFVKLTFLRRMFGCPSPVHNKKCGPLDYGIARSPCHTHRSVELEECHTLSNPFSGTFNLGSLKDHEASKPFHVRRATGSLFFFGDFNPPPPPNDNNLEQFGRKIDNPFRGLTPPPVSTTRISKSYNAQYCLHCIFRFLQNDMTHTIISTIRSKAFSNAQYIFHTAYQISCKTVTLSTMRVKLPTMQNASSTTRTTFSSTCIDLSATHAIFSSDCVPFPQHALHFL